MAKIITEDMIEQAAIKALEESQGYDVLHCYTEDPETLPDNTGRTNKKHIVLPAVLFESLCQINPDVPQETIKIECDKLCHTPVSGDLMLTNYYNYQKIRTGIAVEYQINGRKTSNVLKLINFAEPEKNSFHVASQM